MNRTYALTRQLMVSQNSTDAVHPRDDLSFSFLPPLGDLCINLISQFWLDLASIPREKGQEPLRTTVDNVYLVKRDSMNNFFTFLYFAIGTLHKFRLRKACFSESNNCIYPI